MEKIARQAVLDQAVTSGLGCPKATLESIWQQLTEVDFRPLFGLPIPDPKGRLRGELAVLKRALFRQCVQPRQSRILWRIFLALSGKRKKLLYRAFILNEALSAEQWADLIGPRSFETWCALSLLEQRENRFSWNARVIYTGHSSLICDNDGRENQHVYWGTDSLVLINFCLKHIEGIKRTRYLDVGMGLGAILCGLAPYFQSAVGIDINRRAVQFARLNAKINKLENVEIEEADFFTLNERAERYDVITWNVPYVFRPESVRFPFNDGGELGIDLAIRFMQCVPDLLNPGGIVFAMASSPTLTNGRRPLIEKLQQIASSKELDIQIISQWPLRTGEYKEFLLANDVRAIELVILVAKKGKGSVEYVSRSQIARAYDWL